MLSTNWECRLLPSATLLIEAFLQAQLQPVEPEVIRTRAVSEPLTVMPDETVAATTPVTEEILVSRSVNSSDSADILSGETIEPKHRSKRV